MTDLRNEWQTWEIVDPNREVLVGRIYRVFTRPLSLDTMWVEDVEGGYRYSCPNTTVHRLAKSVWGTWLPPGWCRKVAP